MSEIIENIKVYMDETLEEKIKLLSPDFTDYRILKKSIDARKRHQLHEVYTVEIALAEPLPNKEFHIKKIEYKGQKPIIIGSGPAGLFCALRLAERGIPCTLLERGSPAQKRIIKIGRFWRRGELNEDDNVCFGEGGAGLFSDGKLITRIKSDHIPYIMNRLVKFGAPKEIEYLSNPHVGSDRIRRVIPKIREELIALGCDIQFNTCVEELIIKNDEITGVKTREGHILESNKIVLATGHSASHIFEHLHQQGIALEAKSFAMGLRIEHQQEHINTNQYGPYADNERLGAANYRLSSHHKESGVGVYSFCMCPGGFVLSSGTEIDGIVCNGMSNYNRGSKFANSALAITIDHKSLDNNIFAGMQLRRELEKKCYQWVKQNGGTKEIPAQKTIDFIENRLGETLPTSSPSGVIAANFNNLLPEFIIEPLKNALHTFEKKIPGFINQHSQLHGVESRTSCPIRIPRDNATLQSTSHKGLYPAGEGAGYAGGITSAAVDGIKIAEAISATT